MTPSASTPSVAMVMPVRNEAHGVVDAVCRLRRDFPDVDLVVVDGGSEDGTAQLAAAHCRVLSSAPGRARQMNAGAEATRSDVLWFVHADVQIHPASLAELRTALADGQVVGGGLTLRFDARSRGLDYLAWSSTKRARHLHQIFGDQALFVRRRVFEALGGFPDLPIMEDLELSRRLARVGRLCVLDATVTASARRFAEHGTWSLIAYMQYLKALYFAGVGPDAIARRYHDGPPWVPRRRYHDVGARAAPGRPSAPREIPSPRAASSARTSGGRRT